MTQHEPLDLGEGRGVCFIYSYSPRGLCLARMSAWLFLWMWWILNTAITAAFVVTGLITFRNIHVARPYTHTNTYDENAVLAALFLEVLIVLLFFVISLILLLKNSINREPLSGFGNGVLLASSFHSAMFSLITALVIYSARPLMRTWQRDPNYNWSASSTAAFDASYVLAFLLAGTFLVYAVLILVMRNVFVREEREGKLAPNKTATTAPATATTANTTPAAANGAAPRKRGWFGRKNKAATPAATNDPAAPGTPAATAGAPGTGTATGTPAVGPHTTTGTANGAATTAAPEATGAKTGGAWGPNAV
ncbi:g10581 [Coccomyxa viridis]|uniref:G10581 protein n=1 Tax=Coccomyxa viridis TaxID=1274662 RepID=A0ABP1GA94_9CHLO